MHCPEALKLQILRVSKLGNFAAQFIAFLINSKLDIAKFKLRKRFIIDKLIDDHVRQVSLDTDGKRSEKVGRLKH